MKRLLNTLFVTTQGAYLAKDGETVVVKADHEVLLRVPVHTLGGIVCFGQVSASPFLLGHCTENGVGVTFLTERGRFLARMEGPVSGNVLLRREQYRKADDPAFSASVARSVLAGKLSNSRAVLRRALRDHGKEGKGSGKLDTEAVEQAASRLTSGLEKLRTDGASALDLDALRGLEGDAASEYFSVFDHLITAQKKDFRFAGRNRRPPLDEVNCLLSFIYTLLVHDLRSALETVGLDPAVGYLHRDRPGRPSLALDMMEEFRSFLADRLMLSLINLGRVKRKGFKRAESGAVFMDDDTRKTVLVAYQTRKQEELEHPFLKEKMELGLVLHIQCLLLARHLREDLDAYPPFLWR